LIGRCPEMLEVYKAIGRVAPQDLTVLIRGESGTGKELIARAIYHHSARQGKTVPGGELCGHSGAACWRANCLATRRDLPAPTAAESGSSNSVREERSSWTKSGDMAPLLQAKLLRLLQEQQFERVGGNETIQTDVRIITATNRDLEQLVEEGEFRGDLFYRLNGFTIKLPPLRDRGDDLQLITESMVIRFAQELGKEVQGISTAAMEILGKYSWPGNVRELQGVLRKALLHAKGPILIPDFLPSEVRVDRPELQQRASQQEARLPGDLPRHDLAAFVEERLAAESDEVYAESLQLFERYVVTRVLRQTSGNQSRAAEILGITRGSLRNKIHTLGISIDHVVQAELSHSEESEE
jgi:DNA-binding NtrC family response regulator